MQLRPHSEAPSPFENHVSEAGLLGALDIEFLYMWTSAASGQKTAILAEQALLRDNPNTTPDDLMKFYKKHELYYRVRSHEKVHYWQSISTSYLIFRLFQFGDCLSLLEKGLNESYASAGKIKIPLAQWIARGAQVPESLSQAAELLGASRLFFQIADGKIPDRLGSQSFLQYFLTDGKSSDLGATTVQADPLGARALLEGAAKGSEWLYWLLKKGATEAEAAADLASSLPIYKVAFIEFKKHFPDATLFQALQAFVVTCDYALTLPATAGRLWDFFPGQRAEDVLPGVRFRKLINLWADCTLSVGDSKSLIYRRLTEKASETLGWAGPDENCRSLLEQVERSPTLARQAGVLHANEWNPVATIRESLQVRSDSPYVFVAPVDAAIINERKLNPPEINWSDEGLDFSDQSSLFTIVGRELRESLLTNMHEYGFLCPLRSRPLLGAVFSCDGKCVLKRDARSKPLQQCLKEIKSSHECVLPELVQDLLEIPYSTFEYLGS